MYAAPVVGDAVWPPPERATYSSMFIYTLYQGHSLSGGGPLRFMVKN